MKMFFVTVAIFFISSNAIRAEQVFLQMPEVSTLPIYAMENAESKVNMIAIIGGKGLRNPLGRSKNFLVRQKETFFQNKVNFYLLPNPSKQKKAGFAFRESAKNSGRIRSLVNAIKMRNRLPVFLVGFSRGSVDAASFGKKYPNAISGIVLVSGVYENTSSKASAYSMDLIIGRKLETPILIVHHERDECHVTDFNAANLFFNNLKSERKRFMRFTSGTASGRACGPFHYHGFEGEERNVAKMIASWLLEPNAN